MCIVNVRVQCSDKFSELLVDDVELFDSVLVENVTVRHSPDHNDGTESG